MSALATLVCVACATPTRESVVVATPGIITEVWRTATPFGGVTATPQPSRVIPTPTRDLAIEATVTSRTANDHPPEISVVNIDGALVDLNCDDWWDSRPTDVTMEPGEVAALGPRVHITRLWDGTHQEIDASSPLRIWFASPAPISATLTLNNGSVGAVDTVEDKQLRYPQRVVRWDVTHVPDGEYGLGVHALWRDIRFEASCGLAVRLVR